MWRPSILTPIQLEERRREGGRLLLEGQLTQPEIADRLGVSRRTVCAWAKKIRSSPEGLKNVSVRWTTPRGPMVRPPRHVLVAPGSRSVAGHGDFPTSREGFRRLMAIEWWSNPNPTEATGRWTTNSASSGRWPG